MVKVEFDLQIGDDYYSQSPNRDMVWIWQRQEIFLRGADMGLEEQIARLNEQIDTIGDPIPYPPSVSDEVKAVIDSHNLRGQQQRGFWIVQRGRLQSLHDELIKLSPVK